MRPEIELSWRRSLLCGLDPGQSLPADVTEDLDSESALVRSARPVLEELGQQITGTGLCVLLADRDGRVVRRVFDDLAVERRIDNLGVANGARFSEDAVGTSALGTPLEVRRGVAVNGTEHFLERLRSLSCYGRPIIHPVTSRAEGVLDMTVEASEVNPLFIPFVDKAVRDIERRLLEGSKISQQRLVAAFQDIAPQHHAAVAAVGVDMLLHNNAALNLLDPTDYAVLREIAAEMRAGEGRVVAVDLACGESARVEAESILGSEGGVVFVVRAVDRSTPAIRRGIHASPVQGLGAEVAKLAEASGAVAVCGEPGSGRTTVARDIVGAAQAEWLDASRLGVDGRRRWLRRLTAASNGDAEILVVEHAESLPASLVPVLSSIVDVDAGPRVILTSSPVEDLSPAVAGLIARCPGRVDIPPLRRRKLEFPAIARRILSGFEGSAELTPEALAALSAADWPGNLSELVGVLRTAAESAERNRIELRNLPARYQSCSGRLTQLGGRERAERQAIIDALEAASGNKVHAARELGISRSTLYTRMKALRIPGLSAVR
jgi:transcriptional regulator of acetoin/glycerol metabolism